MKGSIVSCRHLLTSVCFTLGPSRSFRTPPNTSVSRWKRQGSSSSDARGKRRDVVGFGCRTTVLKGEPSNCLAGAEAFGAGAKAAEDPPESAGITQKTSESLLRDANAPTDCVLLLLAADPPWGDRGRRVSN